MRLAPRTEVRVIPDLLHARDEHLGRDTEFPLVRGEQDDRPAQRWRSLRRISGQRTTAARPLLFA